MTRAQYEKRYPILGEHSRLTAEANGLRKGKDNPRLGEIFAQLDVLERHPDWFKRPPYWNGCP